MTQMLSSGEFRQLCYDTIPVTSASANVSFYTNNSKMPIFELWHSCRKWATYTSLWFLTGKYTYISCTFTFNLSIYVCSWMIVQKDQSMHLVRKRTVVSVRQYCFSPLTPAQRTQHTRTGVHSTVPHDNQILQLNTVPLSDRLPLAKLGLWNTSFRTSIRLDSNGKALR